MSENLHVKYWLIAFRFFKSQTAYQHAEDTNLQNIHFYKYV